MIRAALASAGLSADQVDVVEAHGTGTALGDPIEAQALLATYGQDRPGDRPLWLGSVKSNIGHAQAAAGVAGIIKMVLALRHGVLPRDPARGRAVPGGGLVRGRGAAAGRAGALAGRRRAAAAGGRVGVRDQRHQRPRDPGRTPAAGTSAAGEVLSAGPLLGRGVLAWPVSGRSAQGLAGQAGRLGGWVAARPGLDPADVGWSLATTRSELPFRAVVIGQDAAGLTAGLAAVAAGEPAPGVVTGTAGGAGKTVFVFAGQGAQWAGMGRELAAGCPVFAARLAGCGRALAPHVGWDLGEVLAGAEGAPSLEAAQVAQPALWAVMVSLAAVWRAAGVVPDAVIGHSQGEIAAATVAGMLSLEDAARVVAVRGRALSGLGVAGGMVSVLMPEGRVRELMAPWGDRLALAAVNGPAAVVVSGQAEALGEFEAVLAARRVLRWRIPASDFVAHSPAVDRLAPVMARDLAGLAPRPGQVAMFSTVTGEWVEGRDLGAGYWFANVRQPVRFAPAVRALAAAGYRVFAEVSPQPVLTGAVSETLQEAGAGPAGAVVAGTLRREDAGPARFLAALAEVSVHGVAVDWPAVLGAGRQVELPTYAFQHQRYWPAPASARRREPARPATADWRYRVSWVLVPDPQPAVLTGHWLVVVPDSPAGHELAPECVGAMAAGGANVVMTCVRPGADRAELAARVTSALVGEDGFAGVVSLLALATEPLPEHPVVSAGLAATLALVQGLGDAGITAPLWVLTRGAVAAGPGDEVSAPVQAQVWGLGRVVALEHPDRWGGLIDMPETMAERAMAPAWLCAVLAGCEEDQVAIRPAGILARRLSQAPQPSPQARWSVRGTVLVTGGTGAIAGHVARWAAGRGAGRLVLASRSGPAAPGAAGLAARLAAGGTQASVLACDMAGRDQVSGLLARIGSDGPPLTAVLHAAGVVQATPADQVTAADLAAVLAAKAGGAALLDELTADLDLDAFVLFSSISATWGGRPGGVRGGEHVPGCPGRTP